MSLLNGASVDCPNTNVTGGGDSSSFITIDYRFAKQILEEL